MYALWAAKNGHSFTFLAPFLLSILLVIFTIFQIFLPWGRISEMIHGGLRAITYCAYIIYDTDTLIKRSSYDDYIWASISLHLDIVSLFLQLMQISLAASHR